VAKYIQNYGGLSIQLYMELFFIVRRDFENIFSLKVLIIFIKTLEKINYMLPINLPDSALKQNFDTKSLDLENFQCEINSHVCTRYQWSTNVL
jgi:hypothetical protein